MLRKTKFAHIHVKNMTHVTELELNTRAFAPSFVKIPFIPVGRTKECQECAKIFFQVGSSAVRFKNVPLTTESKISLRSRSCSPAIIIILDSSTQDLNIPRHATSTKIVSLTLNAYCCLRKRWFKAKIRISE